MARQVKKIPKVLARDMISLLSSSKRLLPMGKNPQLFVWERLQGQVHLLAVIALFAEKRNEIVIIIKC
jgi:hypothetical protein